MRVFPATVLLATLAMWGSSAFASPERSEIGNAEGLWHGSIIISPAEYELDFILNITRENEELRGSLLYPTQDVTDQALVSIAVHQEEIQFLAIDEQGVKSEFRGTFSTDRNGISGELKERGETYLFTAQRSSNNVGAESKPVVKVLSADGSDLKSAFNRDSERVRLLIVLSPTCPMCKNGARIIQRYVLDAFKDPDLRVYLVWEAVSPSDTLAQAQSAAVFLKDPRAQQFWSQERFAGHAFKEALQLKTTPAWDVFLLFPAKTVWGAEGVPAMSFYMHNLPSREGLSPDLRLNGSELAQAVKSLLEKGAN